MLEPMPAVNVREAGIHAGGCIFMKSVNNVSDIEKRQEIQCHILRKQ